MTTAVQFVILVLTMRTIAVVGFVAPAAEGRPSRRHPRDLLSTLLSAAQMAPGMAGPSPLTSAMMGPAAAAPALMNVGPMVSSLLNSGALSPALLGAGGPVASVMSQVVPAIQPFVESAIGILKMAAIGYVATLFMNSLFPGLLQLIQKEMAPGQPSADESDGDIGRRLQNINLSDAALNSLNIQGTDCRQRAACEVGQYVASNYPSVAEVMHILGNYLPVDPKYVDSLVQGVTNGDCGRVYSSCSYSPFQRVIGSIVAANPRGSIVAANPRGSIVAANPRG